MQDRMLNTKANFLCMFIVMVITFTLNGCGEGKEILISAQEELSVTEKSTITDNTADEELHFFEETIALNGEGGRRAEAECVVITRNLAAKTITLDFGTGCEGNFGRERSGKVFILFTGDFDTKTSGREITFEDYVVNSKGIDGKIQLSTTTRNGDGNATHTRELIDFSVTFQNGETFILNGSTVRELIEGEADNIIGNEVLRVTGEYEGSSSLGRNFNRKIVEPIITDFNCRTSGGFIRVAGTQDITITNVNGSKTRTIKYGTGDCDNEIVVNINGKDYTITIPGI
jgi:hypothetical protein